MSTNANTTATASVTASPGSDTGKAVALSGIGTTTAGRAGLERLVKS